MIPPDYLQETSRRDIVDPEPLGPELEAEGQTQAFRPGSRRVD